MPKFEVIADFDNYKRGDTIECSVEYAMELREKGLIKPIKPAPEETKGVLIQ